MRLMSFSSLFSIFLGIFNHINYETVGNLTSTKHVQSYSWQIEQKPLHKVCFPFILFFLTHFSQISIFITIFDYDCFSLLLYSIYPHEMIAPTKPQVLVILLDVYEHNQMLNIKYPSIMNRIILIMKVPNFLGTVSLMSQYSLST